MYATISARMVIGGPVPVPRPSVPLTGPSVPLTGTRFPFQGALSNCLIVGHTAQVLIA